MKPGQPRHGYFRWASEEDAALRRLVASGRYKTAAEVAAELSRLFHETVSRPAVDCRYNRIEGTPLGIALRMARRAAGAPVSAPATPDEDPPTLPSRRMAPPAEPEIQVDWEEPAPEAQRAPVVEAEDTTESDPDPVARREQRDQVTRLKHTVDDLVHRLREANARQAFIDAAGQFHEPPRIYPRERASGVREMTFVALASDWHIEEPVYPEAVAGRNEYNLEVADKRIERFFRAIIWEVEHHRASGRIAIRDLLLWLGGDLYSGYIHEELVEGNLLSPTEAVHWLLPRLRDGIATLLSVLNPERVVVPCSFGNHGRTTVKSRISTGYANSFDWLLYHWLASEFRTDPRVTFEITASAHQYVDVYGQIAHFHHGDHVRFQGGVGGLSIPLLKRVPSWDRIKPAAVHIIGHYHQLKDFGRAIVNGSLIGYNPFAQSIGADFEEPMQGFFLFDSKRGKGGLEKLWVGERELGEAA